MPDTRHLTRILDEVLPARADANPLVAWSGCEIRRYRRDLFALSPLPDPPSPTRVIPWSVGDQFATLELPSGLGRLEWHPSPNSDGTPVGRAGEPGQQIFEVRFGLTGLNCRPNAGSPARSLKKLYQAFGIPVWWRPYVPLIFAEAALVAVAGICHCRERETVAKSQGELRWRGHAWNEFAPMGTA